MSDLKFQLSLPEHLNPDGLAIRIAGTQSRPMFCLADVGKVLGIGNTRDWASALDEDEKGVEQIDTPGGRQNVVCLTESGLYTVLVRSDKPVAKPFRKWVTGEVLPCIRKHGCYPAPAESAPTPLPPESMPSGQQFGQLVTMFGMLVSGLNGQFQPRRLLTIKTTLAERLRYHGWLTVAKRQVHAIRSLANEACENRFKILPDKLNGEYIYRGEEVEVLDEFIHFVWEKAKEDEYRRKPNLFS